MSCVECEQQPRLCEQLICSNCQIVCRFCGQKQLDADQSYGEKCWECQEINNGDETPSK